MRPLRFAGPFWLALAAVAVHLRPLAAQGTAAAPPPALDSCIAAANRRDYATAERIADASIRSITAAQTAPASDPESLVQMARFVSQCQMPGVDQMRLGELSDQAIDLLTRALAAAPTHWLARYLLALQYYRAPAFLGRGDLAANELDRLIAQQGASHAQAIFARPFEYRGTLWMRAKAVDSARVVWARGLELFPGDTALQRLVRGSAPPQPRPSGALPAATRVPLATTADSLFWRTLHSGAYDTIPRLLLILKAAYLQNPGDARTAAHVGMAHAWRVAERARQVETSPAITDDVILARRYLDLSIARDPQVDARAHGFDAVLRIIEGGIHEDTALAADGLRRGQAAIAAWPEFNWFTVGYVLSARPDTSAMFREALEMQWMAVDACARRTVDRANPTPEAALGALRTEGDSLRKRACTNSWIAPHNLEGFFLNMGDMLVKSGDWRVARKIYELARGTRGVGDYATWPYRDLLEVRVRDAEQNVTAFRRGSDQMMFGSKVACTGCHQAALTRWGM